MTYLTEYNVDEIPRNNYERFHHYLKYIESPEAFITCGFYFLISATLQRRVWIELGDLLCYPNLYIVLVGHSGLGKGRVIRPIKELLAGHEYVKCPHALLENGENDPASGEQDTIEEIVIKLREVCSGNADNNLFPRLVDSNTLRTMTNRVANAIRTIKATKDGKIITYSHSSCCILLEELASQFKEKKETRDIVNFLLQGWDAGDYVHSTYGEGTDEIKRCCISLLAGTTPNEMRHIFDEAFIDEGFAGRTLFVYEDKKRMHDIYFGGLSQSQQNSYEHIKAHINKLSCIYGPMTISDELKSRIRSWYKNDLINRKNKSQKLESYYTKKFAQVLKLAMCVHFADNFNRILTWEDFEVAIELLEKLEAKMHLALTTKARNELAEISTKIKKYVISSGGNTKRELLAEFYEDITEIELDEILKNLQQIQALCFKDNRFLPYVKTASESSH